MRHGKGRQKQIYLTEKGQKMLQEKIYPVMQIENNVFQKMEETEARELLRLFQKYVLQLQAEARELLEEHP